MARLRLFDQMQVFQFWLFDVSGAAGNILFSIFDPTLGFSSCSAPEIMVETKVIQPGNWEYKRKVVKTADVSPISLTRGTKFFDSDFYNWITGAIRGKQPIRRDIILVHFLPWSVQRQLLANASDSQAVVVVQDDATGATSTVTPITNFGQSLIGPELGVTSLTERTPGRAWLLHGCLPTRYKAGSDFDASASDVSIAELEITPEHIDEITLATISPLVGRLTGAGLGIADAVV